MTKLRPESNEDETLASSEHDIVSQIEEYMEAMTRLEKFSGAVLLAHGNQVLHCSGYGFADREHGVRNAPHTKFRLGSISKQFTSTAVMILEEHGRLSVHDPISDYLPYSPDHWKEVTIHHLLNHTSGLGNLADVPGCQEMAVQMSVREVVETFRDRPLTFRPGSEYRYSNSGYFLLGDVIERASGVSYEEFLRLRIFDPLGMVDSGYDHHETILKDRATGYRRQNRDWIRAAYFDTCFAFAAGALYSTVEDLFRWDQTLGAGRVISRESYTRMTTITPLLSCYGYGLEMGREHHRKTVGHAGGINGFRANLVRYPEDAVSVIVLSNSEAADFFGVSKTLAAIFFGEEYDLPLAKTPVNIREDLLTSYIGEYEIVPGIRLQVEREGANLCVSSGQVRSLFLPESEAGFTREDSEDAIMFHGSGGAVSHLVLRQLGSEVAARKVTQPYC